MRSTGLLPLLLLLAGLFPGCKTAPIPDFEPVPVPSGLTSADVETALLVAIIGSAALPTDRSGESLTVDELERAMKLAALTTNVRQGWFLKRRGPGTVEAEYRRGDHRLLMGLDYDERFVRPTILDSQLLKQSEGRIHKAGILWAEQFVDRLPGALRWAAWEAAHRETRSVGEGPAE